jgi:hypothetical protein
MRFTTGSSTTTEQISLMLYARDHSDISSLLMNDSKVTERERERERQRERGRERIIFGGEWGGR